MAVRAGAGGFDGLGGMSAAGREVQKGSVTLPGLGGMSAPGALIEKATAAFGSGAAVPTTVFSVTINNHGGDTSADSFRSRTTAVGVDSLGNVRVTFSALADIVVAHAAIGVWDGTAGTTNCTATPTELLFSGASGFSLTNGNTKVSDSTPFSFSNGNRLIVIVDYTTGDNSSNTSATGAAAVLVAPGATYNVQNDPGGSTFFSDFFVQASLIETLGSSSGCGSMSIAGSLLETAVAQFGAVGGLSTSARLLDAANATFTGSGSLSASARLLEKATATFAGAGSLTANSAGIVSAAVAFAGVGGIVPQPFLIETAAVRFDGVGGLSMAASLLEAASAMFTGEGLFTIVGFTGLNAIASFNGSGGMSAETFMLLKGDAAFEASGTLSTSAYMLLAAHVAFNGEGGLLADAARFGIIQASAVFAGSGSLAASPKLIMRGVAQFNGTGGALFDWFTHANGLMTLARRNVVWSSPIAPTDTGASGPAAYLVGNTLIVSAGEDLNDATELMLAFQSPHGRRFHRRAIDGVAVATIPSYNTMAFFPAGKYVTYVLQPFDVNELGIWMVILTWRRGFYTFGTAECTFTVEA